jgi:microcystin-dependent protein
MKKFFLLFFILSFSSSLSAQEAFIGEIRMFGGNFAPRGWALCDGQLLPISQYTALFSLLGTTYGGDGRTTFALPDLRGRVPIHAGHGPGLSDYRLGQTGGQETVTLTTQQIPAHSHTASVSQAADSSVGTSDKPENMLPARNAASTPQYGTTANVNMSGASVSVGNTGGNLPHENMQPYVTVNYIIALEGIFPSRP